MQPLLYYELVHDAASRFPDKVAVSCGDRRMTFAELSDRTTRLAAVLVGRGVAPGDRVGWWGATAAEVAVLYLAVAEAGAIFCPVNPRFSEAEAAAVLDWVGATLVVSDGTLPGDLSLDGLLAEQPRRDRPLPQVDEASTHVMFFTSGTTGRPKGVEISHRADRLRALSQAVPFPRGPSIVMFPQFHMAAWKHTHEAWASGDEAVLVDGGDTEAILHAVQDHRAARLYALPAVWRRILALDLDAYDLRSLRFTDTGTSSTPPELLDAIGTAFPQAAVTVTYGSTEAGIACRLGPDDVRTHPGSVGPLLPGVRARVEDGELWLRSPFLFSRYYGDEEATAAALVHGWFHTGELVERTAEGYFSIVGRKADIIRTGGESVAPAEVDAVLQSHPDVVDAAVAGVPDVDWGELVTAFVVVRSGATVDLEVLRGLCAGRLASYKHPRRLVVVDAVPRTGPTQQVQRSQLAALAQEARVDRPLGADVAPGADRPPGADRSPRAAVR